MTLNEKVAFEVWTGIAVLVVVVGTVAGATLLLSNPSTTSQIKTQASNQAQTSVAPFASESDITNAASGITGALLGGANAP